MLDLWGSQDHKLYADFCPFNAHYMPRVSFRNSRLSLGNTLILIMRKKSLLVISTNHRKKYSTYLYSASRLQGPLFQFFTNAFVFFCRMGTVGDVKLKVCIHVDKSFLIVCV